MSKKDKIWIEIMEAFSKYWGCHQLPERSFFFHGYQFPVCARCTGIIIGYLLAACITPFFNIKGSYLMIMCIPMAVDGGLQQITKYTSTNVRRIITGILYGFGFLGILIHIIKSII